MIFESMKFKYDIADENPKESVRSQSRVPENKVPLWIKFK